MLVKQLLVKHSLMSSKNSTILETTSSNFQLKKQRQEPQSQRSKNYLVYQTEGAIDGTHIKIKAQKESAVDYFSRYQQHDVAVQGIVDGRKIFMDIAAAAAAGFLGILPGLRTEILRLKIEMKFSGLTFSFKSWRVNKSVRFHA